MNHKNNHTQKGNYRRYAKKGEQDTNGGEKEYIKNDNIEEGDSQENTLENSKVLSEYRKEEMGKVKNIPQNINKAKGVEL